MHRTTGLSAGIFGEHARVHTRVLVEEIAEGGWGIGDAVLALARLRGD
ncbi:hypothetical protein AB0F91_23655 [Amycolatopsis sp. NPDC023774]